MNYQRIYWPDNASESDSGASAGRVNNPAHKLEAEAVHKRAGDPGSIENAAGMHGDLDGGGGIGNGTREDAHLNRGDTGPTPDKISLEGQ